MKKKIVLGLSFFALMFFLGGVYIVTTTETTIYELHGLAELHNIDDLRKNLLKSIEENQNNIMLSGTRYAMAAGVSGVESMQETVNKCLVCHRSDRYSEIINKLISRIGEYQEMTRVILSSSPPAVTERQTGVALRLGNDLIKQMGGLIIATSSNLEKKRSEILYRVNQRKKLLFLMVTVGPFFAVGLAFVLINGIAKPVKSLLYATRRLKAGDLDYRIEGMKDEFGEVADSFNEMASALKKEMLEMQRTEQLKVCGEMAAGLAHEIRNPLAGIKVSIEVLLAELDLEERDRTALLTVVEEIRRIELLMKNMLNFARPATAQLMTVNINNILEVTAKFLERHPSFSMPASHKEIIRKFDAGLPDTAGDPQQLQQVFLNLFLNAAEAMPDGGTLTVKTGSDVASGAIFIEVSDTGKGISSEARKRIFQPFFTTKAKGTGLGLAISKRLVEEHGGSITVTNNISGGATFNIIFPVREKEKTQAV